MAGAFLKPAYSPTLLFLAAAPKERLLQPVCEYPSPPSGSQPNPKEVGGFSMRGIGIACGRTHYSASDVERHIGVAAICGIEQRGARLRADYRKAIVKRIRDEALNPLPRRANQQSQAAVMMMMRFATASTRCRYQ